MSKFRVFDKNGEFSDVPNPYAPPDETVESKKVEIDQDVYIRLIETENKSLQEDLSWARDDSVYNKGAADFWRKEHDKLIERFSVLQNKTKWIEIPNVYSEENIKAMTKYRNELYGDLQELEAKRLLVHERITLVNDAITEMYNQKDEKR